MSRVPVARRSCACGATIEMRGAVHERLLAMWDIEHSGGGHEPVNAADARAVRMAGREGGRVHCPNPNRPAGSNPNRRPLCGSYTASGVAVSDDPDEVTCGHCRRLLDGG